jgi:hypothetical protein
LRRIPYIRRMIPYKRKNSLSDNLKKVRKEPYLLINIILAGVIILIMLYSGLFSSQNDNYPVTCLHEKLTGEPCFSCGLSHSFSLIIRGKFTESYQWNLFGMQVFLFFVSQLILRIAFSIYYLKHPDTRRQLIITDGIGSGFLFLIAFNPFLESIFSDTLGLIF